MAQKPAMARTDGGQDACEECGTTEGEIRRETPEMTLYICEDCLTERVEEINAELDAERREQERTAPDRWTVEGSVGSSAARHVLRVLREAFGSDTLFAGVVDPENVTIQGADASGTGSFGNARGLTVYILASVDLQTRESFEEYLHANLNEGYWFEIERTGVYTFLYDGEDGTRPVR